MTTMSPVGIGLQFFDALRNRQSYNKPMARCCSSFYPSYFVHSTMEDLAIGTDGWKGYSETSYETERLVRDYEKVINWGNATSFCAARRHVPCRIGPDFVVGSNHLIRIVEFEDGVKWVLKVPLPPLDIYSVKTSPTPRLVALRSEVATMKFLKYVPPLLSLGYQRCV